MNMKMEKNASNDCGRKEDLVAYLYDEAGAAERTSFERHLTDCQSCRSEIGIFGRLRDDLSLWQVGAIPRTEIALPKQRLDILRDLILLFPVWARGTALTAAGLALLLFAFSFAAPRLSLGEKRENQPLQKEVTSAQIDSLIKEAVARERASVRENFEEEYRAQVSNLKRELNTEYQTKLEAAKASLKTEIRRSDRRNPSIRSFFAMDDYQDPWGDTK
jgi:hypothetical protein